MIPLKWRLAQTSLVAIVCWMGLTDGVPTNQQDRIAKRLGLAQKTIHYHLGKMPVLANFLNTDLSHGFTVAQVAQKHGWTEPMVWSLALEDKDDQDRFKKSNQIKSGQVRSGQIFRTPRSFGIIGSETGMRI